jgi:hypothetical protein
MSRTPFVYRPRTLEQLQRRIAIGGWDKGIYDAYKGDAKALCNYLRSPDLPLDDQKRMDLADLIERRIQRKQGKGRKPGVTPSIPGLMTTRDVVATAKNRLKWIRMRNGGRCPPGTYKQVLEAVLQEFGDQGYNVEVDFDIALDALRRGRRAHLRLNTANDTLARPIRESGVFWPD